MDEEKITDALVKLERKLYSWPRTTPLSDAEMNERVDARMKILEEQKRMLLAAEAAKK
jgi:hypothetical protein